MAVDILGLVGPQGSGKDTVADLLVEECGWVKISFADPVRECAWAINPVIVDEKIVGGWDEYRSLVNEYGYDKAKRSFPEMRTFLQTLATDAVRDIIGKYTWTELWLERAYKALEEGKRVVAADVRFETELETLEAAPGVAKIARIHRPGVRREDSHASEAYESQIQADFPIYNEGTIEQLRFTIKALDEQLASLDT